LARGGVANFGSISSLAKDGGNAHTFKGGKQYILQMVIVLTFITFSGKLSSTILDF
jgi:hypothetical protein